VHAVTLRLAEQEILRTFRRRETFWVLLGIASLFGLVHLVVALMWARPEELSALPFVADIFRGQLVVWEALSLFVVASQGGKRTVRQELDAGSWILLAQTPNPTSRIWAGKLLGVVVSLLAVHGILSLPILAFTPLVRRTHAEVALLFFGVFLYAAALVPEGMVFALVEKRSPRLVYPLRLLSGVRFVLPLPFLLAATTPDLLGARPGPELLGPALAPFPSAESASPELFAHPWVPVAVILAVQLVTAVPWWLALARSRR
jgi:hypothetical protein